LKNLIRPALTKLGYSVPARIDQLEPVGSITDAIISQLERADLVVADLAGLNPNVMFEMGIREAWAKPLIPIAPNDLKLPFDVAGVSTVFYPSLEGRTKLNARQKKKVVEGIQLQAKQFQSGE